MTEPAEPLPISRISSEPGCFDQSTCRSESLFPQVDTVSLSFDQQCRHSILRDLGISAAQQVQRVAIHILQHPKFLMWTPRIDGVERMLVGRKENYASEKIAGD